MRIGVTEVCIFCSSTFILIAYLCKRLRCESAPLSLGASPKWLRTYREVFCKAFGESTGLLIDGFICTNGFFACLEKAHRPSWRARCCLHDLGG